MTKSEKIIRRGILVNAMKKAGYRLNKEAKGCCENCPFKPVIADECVHTYIDEIWCEQERKVEASTITTEVIEKMTRLAKGSTSWFAEKQN